LGQFIKYLCMSTKRQKKADDCEEIFIPHRSIPLLMGHDNLPTYLTSFSNL